MGNNRLQGINFDNENFVDEKKINKKVLLRERKRHTDRGSIKYSTQGGVPPARSNRGAVPEVGYPPAGVPPLAGVPPGKGTPLAGPG